MASIPDRLPRSQEIEAVAKEFATVPALRGYARQLREMQGGDVVANLKEHIFDKISPDALRGNPQALKAVRKFLEKYPEAGAKVNFVHAPVHRLLLMAESPALGNKADLANLDVPVPSIVWNLIEKGVKEKPGDWINQDGVIEGITADNIWQMLEFAHHYQVENLEKACFGFLRNNKQLLKEVDQLSQYAVQKNMGRLLMILVEHCKESNIEVPQSLKPFAEFAEKYNLGMLIKGSLEARVEDPQHLLEHPERIYINHIDLTGRNAQPLFRNLNAFPFLWSVQSEGTEIDDNCCVLLAEALKTNNTVTVLNLSYNKIGKAGATALAEALKVNHTLTELDLRGNPLTDEGVKKLAEALKFNKALQEIYLDETQMTDRGVAELVQALQVNKTVKMITIWHNFSVKDVASTKLAEVLKENAKS